MTQKWMRMLFLLVLLGGVSSAQSQSYRNATQLNAALQQLAKQNSNMIVHELSKTQSGTALLMLEIGSETNAKTKVKPAIFVLGNPDGTTPLGSEAAIMLAEKIKTNENAKRFTWYILPTLSPDALNRYFGNALFENPANSRPVNQDMDDATDEDGPEDLNGDGIITQMRVLDPQGTFLIHSADARVMRKASGEKGEKGMYKLYPEGLDNDLDGKYNEDPAGGVNNALNFPHLFKSFKPNSGLWPGSEAEVYAVIEFIYAHPEIAATFTFGNTDFCLVPPKGGRKGSANFSKIKVPKRLAGNFGLDPARTYTMDEIIEHLQPMVPAGMELTPSMIAGFLGLGAAVNPQKADLSFYGELSKQYKKYLKNLKVNTERLSPAKAKDGSFELWSYYHLGVPTFSMNFFTLEKAKKAKADKEGLTVEQIEKMTPEEFEAAGEEKISAFLIANNAPKQYTAAKLIEMVKGGKLTPEQLAGMLKQMPKPKDDNKISDKVQALLNYSDNELDGKGYINWTPFDHPTLGKVEIGGAAPFVYHTPKAEWIDSLITLRLPWVFTVTEKLPALKIEKYTTKALGAGMYELNIWVTNTAYLPYPTSMGERNKQPAPIILLIEGAGIEAISGKLRTPIQKIEGNSTLKYRYLLKTTKGGKVNITLSSPSIGQYKQQINLK